MNNAWREEHLCGSLRSVKMERWFPLAADNWRRAILSVCWCQWHSGISSSFSLWQKASSASSLGKQRVLFELVWRRQFGRLGLWKSAVFSIFAESVYGFSEYWTEGRQCSGSYKTLSERSWSAGVYWTGRDESEMGHSTAVWRRGNPAIPWSAPGGHLCAGIAWIENRVKWGFFSIWRIINANDILLVWFCHL